ncbi:hypothetical protein LOZ12_002574 [Ophidiomyces ophidiicola]|uniref:Uncharacterized protein n=1 Tax=Ophidiomyces ophidiicola TaxID=1387563 RepID=A0ACB8V2F4_9EURO|nr:uncharacterized protein LOZ57_005298 [Ophidiomyces ophidiicola]KAI1942274.1 hypothetical protein LOZ57_005298 [Ophidiomyces ophidiicola]KAI1947017.1 hypothetical protein LOZ62_003162 [Ophidiomyces ophidiicola]KAI1972038.1 hypothetical protein LOZ56_002726 [Ophidiomyces ophidiicola]KAI1999050.1 hypothetical protein LOZ50_006623 [Ophidiomyces ophidiicola]KAI2017350.1 hypothetical protein LOZ46_004432 [Ophidiomyces ophidiicola]
MDTDAKMLSDTWRSLRHNSSLRANLFRDISRITLSLARHTFPHIGSLRMDDRGFVRLSNRPLTLRLQHLENEGIPTQISRGQLYFTSDAYILDLLACYDSKLRHQPNSMLDFVDGCSQMAAVTALRATHSHYLQRDFRYGPFIFMLTDLHQSNIFVDENWNVKYIIDLEWTCTQPIEMLRAPYWLTDRSVDNLLPEDGLEEFTKMHAEFLESFEKEEKKMQDRDPNFNIPLFGRQFTDIMRSCWENGSFWFFYALENPKGLFSLFYYHLLPRYGPTDPNFYNGFCSYWAVDAAELVGKKLKDKEDYDIKLREAFQKESEGSQR